MSKFHNFAKGLQSTVYAQFRRFIIETEIKFAVNILAISLWLCTLHHSCVRDLGVILDSQLSIGACRGALLGQVVPTSTTMPGRSLDDGGSCKNRSCGVYIILFGLL